MLNTGPVIGGVIGGRYNTIALLDLYRYSQRVQSLNITVSIIYSKLTLFACYTPTAKPMQRIQFFFQVSNSRRYQS